MCLASLGARLFSPKHLSSQVGWTIRKGYDFPAENLRQLETWGMTLSIIQEENSPSTRGQLEYLDSTFASNDSTLIRLESAGDLTTYSTFSKDLQIHHSNLDHRAKALAWYTAAHVPNFSFLCRPYSNHRANYSATGSTLVGWYNHSATYNMGTKSLLMCTTKSGRFR